MKSSYTICVPYGETSTFQLTLICKKKIKLQSTSYSVKWSFETETEIWSFEQGYDA